jgi:hypothetical protein
MTPPFVIGLCAYSGPELSHQFNGREFIAHMVVFSLIGLLLWGLGCLILWYGILLPNFRTLTRREEFLIRDQGPRTSKSVIGDQ